MKIEECILELIRALRFDTRPATGQTSRSPMDIPDQSSNQCVESRSKTAAAEAVDKTTGAVDDDGDGCYCCCWSRKRESNCGCLMDNCVEGVSSYQESNR